MGTRPVEQQLWGLSLTGLFLDEELANIHETDIPLSEVRPSFFALAAKTNVTETNIAPSETCLSVCLATRSPRADPVPGVPS